MPEHLRREIDRLKKAILTLCALVEEDVRKAGRSVAERDAGLANSIIEKDAVIDHMEIEVEEECLKILALYQPVAVDLRFIVSVLKINNDLERIGDLAVNIAEQAAYLATQERVEVPFDFPGMAQKVQSMLKRSVDALVNMDSDLARRVCAADDEVDAIHRDMYTHVQNAILRNPEAIDRLIRHLSVSRNFERIADHATNIAEDVVYLVEGEIVRHGEGAKQSQNAPGREDPRE